jgi:hypothetical protein
MKTVVLALFLLPFLPGVIAGTTTSHTDIVLRPADVVSSRSDGFEVVFRVSVPTEVTDPAFQAAVIELDIGVAGEDSTFAPFVLIATAAEPDPERGGHYRVIPHVPSREFVLHPGDRSVRLDATSLVRAWLVSHGDRYLRVTLDEPRPTERDADAVTLRGQDSVARIVILTRPSTAP